MLSDGSRVYADVIVDASGRGSKTSDYLASAGYKQPDIKQVNSHLVYTTASYDVPPEGLQEMDGKCCLMVQDYFPGTKTAMLLPTENGKFQVSYSGCCFMCVSMQPLCSNQQQPAGTSTQEGTLHIVWHPHMNDIYIHTCCCQQWCLQHSTAGTMCQSITFTGV